MVENDFIKQILLLFRACYGERFEISQATSGVWTTLLQGISEKELNEAAREVCKTNHYPPTPADVIDVVKKNRSNSVDILQRTASDIWEGAKQKMLRDKEKYRNFLAAKNIPSYIKQSFEAVGGIRLCTMSDIDSVFPRFERVFNELKNRYKAKIEETPREALPSSKMGGVTLGLPRYGGKIDYAKVGD